MEGKEDGYMMIIIACDHHHQYDRGYVFVVRRRDGKRHTCL